MTGVIPSVSEGPVWVDGAPNMLCAPPVHTDPSLTLGMTRRQNVFFAYCSDGSFVLFSVVAP